MMVDEFEVGKKYKHQVVDRIATCIAFTSRGQPVLEWDDNGIVHSDVVPYYWSEYKEPKRGTVWINIYKNMAMPYNSKEHANRFSDPSRLACIEVPWVEGQGLE